MGRGRAKAKQTKVARELKYSTRNTDFDALQRELSGTPDDHQEEDRSISSSDDYDDGYDDYRR
jgi:hypothetical protein